MQLSVKKLGSQTTLPTRAYGTDHCFDFYAAEDVTLRPGQTVAVSLGVAVAPPEQYALILKERSGLALKGIGIKGGVIDNGYRGELKAIVQWIPPEGFGAASADINIFKLGNMSEGRPATEEQMQTLADALQHVNDDVPLNLIWNEDIELEVLKLGTFEIKAGDKICQGKLELTRDHCPVVEVDDLGETPRGADGFGSTGT